MEREPTHEPVMVAETIGLLDPSRGGLFVDCTVGLGGHAHALIEAGASRLLGLDRDTTALALAAAALAAWGDRVELVHADYRELGAILDARGLDRFGGVLADLGVSSMQFDTEGRGFSFRRDEPLDMRMDRTQGPTAADLLAAVDEEDLANVIFQYGEERFSRRVARRIVDARRAAAITMTGQLARIVRGAVPHKGYQRIDPATRTFQALRIHINRELEELVRALGAAEKLLKPGGRLAVVCFHSLEDRIAKKFLVERSGHAARPSRHRPAATVQHPAFMLLNRNPLTPSEAEVEANPRSRSAKLRAAVRTDAPARPLTRDLLLLASSGGRP
jgi:16S rRNA (cytosine1402-N4)-methyltransferase